jgi:hypothetical protein
LFENIEVFGLERSAVTSGYPMAVEAFKRPATDKDYDRFKKLGSCKSGEGHDSALKGIIVQMDVTLSQHVWLQAMRYSWFDVVSSQSKMHRLLSFNIKQQVTHRVTDRAIENLEILIEKYKNGEVDIDTVMDNVPCGLQLTAEVTTNYLQLKTMYLQRRNHRLKAWQVMCDQMEKLPMFLDLIKRGV